MEIASGYGMLVFISTLTGWKTTDGNGATAQQEILLDWR
jgi:hypothetical protein